MNHMTTTAVTTPNDIRQRRTTATIIPQVTNFVNTNNSCSKAIQQSTNGTCTSSKVNDIKTKNSTATPPIHTLMVFSCMLLTLLYHFPSMEQMDDIATIQIISGLDSSSRSSSSRSSSNILSIYTIATIRCSFAMLIWMVVVHMLWNRSGWYIITPYLPQSYCIKNIPIHMIGIKTLYPFTSWCYIVLGLYFTGASLITVHAIQLLSRAQDESNNNGNNSSNDERLRLQSVLLLFNEYNHSHRYLLRCTIILWEISAPLTILVAVIIRYVMWPAAMQRIAKQQRELQEKNARQMMSMTPLSITNDTEEEKKKKNQNSDDDTLSSQEQQALLSLTHSLNSYQNICMHNGNVLMALMEKCIVTSGTMPIRIQEWTLAPLFGCVYILFTWSIMYSWHNTTNTNTSNNMNGNKQQRNYYGPQFIYFFLDTTIRQPTYFCSIVLLSLLAVLLVFFTIYCLIEPLLDQMDRTIDQFWTDNDDGNDNNSNTSGKEYMYMATHMGVVLLICSAVTRFRD